MGEAASGFLARLITESGSSGLGTGVGDVASVGVTNTEDDVSQTVNMKENRGYQHSHCVCVGGSGPEVQERGWREREGGRVQLFRFVRSSAPPPPSPSSTSASSSSSSPDSISTSPSPSTLIGRIVVLPRGCTPNDLGHDSDSDIGFLNDALDSVSHNRPCPPTSVPSPQQPRGLVSCGSHISSRRIHSVDPTPTIGGTGQTQMWFVVFEVQRRLLAERVIRLGLIGQGYGWVRFEEPCSCGTSHHEYHWMRTGGSLEEIETIARESLAIIEEPTVIRINLRPRRRCARYSAGLLRFRRR
ncbi:hypothetical protein B0H14DRAFT_2583668 [Mycena olivaceomarginata]|nr:hypothetical protein B0H14DRAFT_2583668 [Mycena olivaceomarginata]